MHGEKKENRAESELSVPHPSLPFLNRIPQFPLAREHAKAYNCIYVHINDCMGCIGDCKDQCLYIYIFILSVTFARMWLSVWNAVNVPMIIARF